MVPAPPERCSGIAFLTENAFLLTDARNGSLHMFEIHQAGGHFSVVPVGSLGLPPLLDGGRYELFRCRARPNYTSPTESHGPNLSDSPLFSVRPSSSIIVFDVAASDKTGIDEIEYTFVVHRHALLKLTQPSNPSHILWNDWGPPVTRWFSGMSEDELKAKAFGQRYVAMPTDWASPIVIWDFNQFIIQRLLRIPGSIPESVNIIDEESVIEMQDVFAERVKNRLPCIQIISPFGDDKYGTVLLDEDNWVGLKVCVSSTHRMF